MHCTTLAYRLRPALTLLADGTYSARGRLPQWMTRSQALAAERPVPAQWWQIAVVGLLALTAILWRPDGAVSRIGLALADHGGPQSIGAWRIASDRARPGSADHVNADVRPTTVSVYGVLPDVQDGETLGPVAERYARRFNEILAEKDLASPGRFGPAVPIGATVSLAADATRASTHASRSQPDSSEGDGLPVPTRAAGWQRDFILAVAPGARESQRRTGVPASVTLAQAILESDWGRSKLTREANNLFGIKARSGPGSAGTYEIETDEVDDDQIVTVQASFRAYTSLADSIVDHGRWFHENSRYRTALEVDDDPRTFAYAISDAGYATDPDYAPKLIGLMDRFNLYAYNVPPDGQSRPSGG